MSAWEKGWSKHSVQLRVGTPSSFWCAAHIPSYAAPQPAFNRSKGGQDGREESVAIHQDLLFIRWV